VQQREREARCFGICYLKEAINLEEKRRYCLFVPLHECYHSHRCCPWLPGPARGDEASLQAQCDAYDRHSARAYSRREGLGHRPQGVVLQFLPIPYIGGGEIEFDKGYTLCYNLPRQSLHPIRRRIKLQSYHATAQPKESLHLRPPPFVLPGLDALLFA
jgi:hypothetical protein